MELPESQDGIKVRSKELKEQIDALQEEQEMLRTWCKHPNAETGEYLGRKGWKRCRDCGFWDEWWLG